MTTPGYQEWRGEYRKALLWDEKHTKEAISEYRRVAAERPGDFDVHRTLAMLLARDNPRNPEAASLYSSLVKTRPDDHALRLEYVHVLSADPKRRSEAIQQYRALVREKPTPELQEALADLLAARPEGRKEAIELYEDILRDEPEKTSVRLKYANLLAADTDDTHLADRRVRNDSPRRPEERRRPPGARARLCRAPPAHQGPPGGEPRGQARREVRGRGRAAQGPDARAASPNLEAFMRGFSARKIQVEARRHQVGAGGRADLGTAVTLRAEGGGEDYWRGSQDAAGAFARTDADFHLDLEDDIGLGVGYHTFGVRSIVGRAEYLLQGDHYKFGFGVDRSLRYDSYVAVAGDRIPITSARSAPRARIGCNRLGLRGGARPVHADAPTAASSMRRASSANPFGGGRAEWRYKIYNGDRLQVSPILAAEGVHYQFNAFGVDLGPDGVRSAGEARTGGYFSPKIFGSGEAGSRSRDGSGRTPSSISKAGPRSSTSRNTARTPTSGSAARGSSSSCTSYIPRSTGRSAAT